MLAAQEVMGAVAEWQVHQPVLSTNTYRGPKHSVRYRDPVPTDPAHPAAEDDPSAEVDADFRLFVGDIRSVYEYLSSSGLPSLHR